MREVALQFSAYYGFAKGEFLNQVAEETWDRLVEEALEPVTSAGSRASLRGRDGHSRR
jgi:hypothetical protein